jgi:hypothetical protein
MDPDPAFLGRHRDPGDPDMMTPAYNGGDDLHFDLAGYQALAGAVNLAALARPNCT